jgi:CelD/BcsL family acetyltransferase involved in cellulose biosynthesis
MPEPSDRPSDGAPAVDIYPRVEPIAAEWEALADRTATSPFARAGWFRVWSYAFGRGRSLIVAVRRDGKLAAVAPFELHGRIVRSATNWHTPEYELTAEDQAAAQTLAAAVLAHRPRRLELHFLDPQGLALRAFRAAAGEARYRVLLRSVQQSPYVPTDGDWNDSARRLKALLKETARQRRRLDESGAVSVDMHTGGAGTEQALEACLQLEQAGWKGKRGTAIASRPETRAFYTGLARWAADRGWLRLTLLSLDGRPLAFELNLEAGGSIYSLKTAYDESYRRLAPGKLLSEAIIRDAFERDIRTYECLGAADQYKLQWTNEVRERLVLQAFAPTPLGFLELAIFRYVMPAARRARARLDRRLVRAVRARGRSTLIAAATTIASGWAPAARAAARPRPARAERPR